MGKYKWEVSRIMNNKKVLIAIGVLVLAIIACIYIKNMKTMYTVYYTNEYGYEVEKAYSVNRPLKWTKEDEFKTEEYREALSTNKHVVPTGIKVVSVYAEIISNPYFLMFLVIVGYLLAMFYKEISERLKKRSPIEVKIIEPVKVINNN